MDYLNSRSFHISLFLRCHVLDEYIYFKALKVMCASTFEAGLLRLLVMG